ncbi:hypothetical protein DUNSADRAFT_6121 [Dunaliella salina]|uniref:Uncharacterized protein n=1 Tax=Dunaliella salina TaxID=3046 RepID=A0ABQ7H726_DUNSA|nr:hypothetical protein DUNSADRAFT_6121 [Dunaliella salina]|eukprot:KAF5842651.1 hypothetical protein DUNSADRAFT_6121 [Dunaliella salina]
MVLAIGSSWRQAAQRVAPSQCTVHSRLRPLCSRQYYHHQLHHSQHLLHQQQQQHSCVCSSVPLAGPSGGLTPGEFLPEREDLDAAEDADAKAFALQCANMLDETKCQDLTVLHVAPLVTWCSYMVFATVMSKPQLLAALARIEKMARQDEEGGRERLNQPGSSPWECLDYGSVVIHLFTQEQREIYDVEGFYAAAEEVELPFSVQVPGSGSPVWTS